MFKLRDYQNKAKEEIRNCFQRGLKRVVLCMPTGAGKTVTFVDMVAGVIPKNMRAMIMCDRKELIKQANKKINELGLTPTIIAPKHLQIKNNVYLASVDTLKRREMPEVDLIIIDEAHKQTFDNTIKKYIDFCNPFIIGATATPLRTGKQNSLDDFYQGIVCPVTTQQLIDLGYLVPARTFAAKEDYSDIKMKGSDFDNGALFNKFNQTKLYDGVVENYLKFANGLKAICFNVNVEHSKNMCQKFRENGIRAEHIDGNTPDRERERILKAFETENFVLCNCSILTTGFDEPSIKCVIINRATMSLPLFLQMAGRGSRIFEGKDNFIIIDQGANVYRHGMWEEDREWSLQKKVKKKKSDGVAPVKVCDSCHAINHNSARKCKVCDAPFEIKEKKLAKSEFVEVKKNRGARKIPDIKTASRQELSEYAKLMGYKQGWVFKQLQIAGRM